MNKQEYRFTWIIENYSFCYLKHRKSIISPIFLSENFDESKWFLELCAENEIKELISCSLFNISGYCDGETNIVLTLEVVNDQGVILKTNRTESKLYKKINYVSPTLINTLKLFNKESSQDEYTIIVRSKITKQNTINESSICSEVKTKFGIDRQIFQWELQTFNKADWSDSKRVFFPNSVACEIILTPPEDDVLIDIKRIDKELFLCCVIVCKITLLDNKWDKISSMKDSRTLVPTQDIWKFPSFFKKSQLQTEQFINCYLMCEFSLCRDIFHSEVMNLKCDNDCKTNPLPKVDTMKSLLDDLKNMFNSKLHSDAELKAEDKIIPVHKSILTARSPVFNAMFSQEMIENQTGVVIISDTDSKTLDSFLEFLYTGTLDALDCELALKLLVLADKYQVSSLREYCATFLTSILSISTVCEILLMADLVGHEYLKASSIEFIKSHAHQILSSPDWYKWIEKNFKIGIEVLCKLSENIGASIETVPNEKSQN